MKPLTYRVHMLPEVRKTDNTQEDELIKQVL